jgi:heme-degrading monooxygenase HmoA
LNQAQGADGYLTGSVLRDRRLIFWTLSVWESQASMRAYIRAGRHRAVMPMFAVWCDEASVGH